MNQFRCSLPALLSLLRKFCADYFNVKLNEEKFLFQTLLLRNTYFSRYLQKTWFLELSSLQRTTPYRYRWRLLVGICARAAHTTYSREKIFARNYFPFKLFFYLPFLAYSDILKKFWRNSKDFRETFRNVKKNVLGLLTSPPPNPLFTVTIPSLMLIINEHPTSPLTACRIRHCLCRWKWTFYFSFWDTSMSLKNMNRVFEYMSGLDTRRKHFEMTFSTTETFGIVREERINHCFLVLWWQQGRVFLSFYDDRMIFVIMFCSYLDYFRR